MPDPSAALACTARYREPAIATWHDLLRIASVSTDPAYAEGVRRCASRLADHLRGLALGAVEAVNHSWTYHGGQAAALPSRCRACAG